MSSAILLLAPEMDPSDLKRKKKKAWETKLTNLVGYRGVYEEISLKNGVVGYLANRGEKDEFALGEFPESDELGSLEKMAEAFPGHYLAGWTYGGVVNFWIVNKASDRDLEVSEFSFRLTCPATIRCSEKVDAFLELLRETPFEIDEALIKSELAREEIAVNSLFSALGIPGASGVVNDDAQDLWEVFASAADGLLRGENVPGVEAVNEHLRKSESGELLPTEKCERPGETARRVSYARSELEEVIGEPGSTAWTKRIEAANYYWDITDSEDSCARLIYAKDDKGPGNAAALGRLLGHYPEDLMRDGVFLAEAALEAESANGHGYVEALSCLAECCHQSGFTLVVFPTDLQSVFRESFGIGEYEEGDHHRISPDWSAEAFLDIDGLVEATGTEVFSAWLRDHRCEGAVIRAHWDGNFEYERVGKELPEQPLDECAITEAARLLWPRGVFPALGLPDLLEPGEWYPGAYSGWAPGEKEKFEAEMRAKAESVLKQVAESDVVVEKVSDFWVLQGKFPRSIYYVKCEEAREEEVYFKISFPEGQWNGLGESLISDLMGRGLIDDYGNCWQDDERNIVGYSRSNLSTAMFCRALCDLPVGTGIDIYTTDQVSIRYSLDPTASINHRSTSLLLSEKKEDDDYEEDEEWDDEELAEFDEAMEALGFKMTQLFPKRPTLFNIELDSDLIDDVVFEDGDTSFCSLDLSKEQIGPEEELNHLEAKWIEAGFTQLGDLLCSHFDNVIMRCYGREDETAFGVIMMPLIGDLICECYTAFEGGVSITTTTNPHPCERPDSGAFMERCPPKADPLTVYESHMKRVGILLGERRSPVPAKPGLVSQAKAVHEFLSRVFSAIL